MSEGDRRLLIVGISVWMLAFIIFNVLKPVEIQLKSDTISNGSIAWSREAVCASDLMSKRRYGVSTSFEQYMKRCNEIFRQVTLENILYRSLGLLPPLLFFLVIKYRKTTKNPTVWIKEGYNEEPSDTDSN